LFMPLFLHFGVKGYGGDKLDMKKFVHIERYEGLVLMRIDRLMSRRCRKTPMKF
jgi:hypothetical protein